MAVTAVEPFKIFSIHIEVFLNRTLKVGSKQDILYTHRGVSGKENESTGTGLIFSIHIEVFLKKYGNQFHGLEYSLYT